jgi:hypothetical protein
LDVSIRPVAFVLYDKKPRAQARGFFLHCVSGKANDLLGVQSALRFIQAGFEAEMARKPHG